MTQSSVIHNTFVVHRTYAKPPERVFVAFSDTAKKRRWYAEGDHHDVEEFEMTFRVGGTERLAYRLKQGTPFPGVVIVHDGLFLDIEPNRRIVAASAMMLGDRRISATLVTSELIPEAAGTQLICTVQGAYFEGSDGPQLREAGWRKLLDSLAAELAR